MAIGFDENICANTRRSIPRFRADGKETGSCAVIGGAPSVLDHIEQIRALTIPIFSSLSSHKWLVGIGARPTYCVINEIYPDPAAAGQERHDGVMYLIGSHCHPANFDHFAPNVRMWHTTGPMPFEQRIRGMEPGAVFIDGQIQWSTRSLAIGKAMGYRHFECFGLDSSYIDQSHAYPDDLEQPINHEFNGHTYRTDTGLLRQTRDFMKFCKAHPDLKIDLYGRGLLPDMLRSR